MLSMLAFRPPEGLGIDGVGQVHTLESWVAEQRVAALLPARVGCGAKPRSKTITRPLLCNPGRSALQPESFHQAPGENARSYKS